MVGALPISPLAPKDGFPKLSMIRGVRFASAAAGIKYQGRNDVMVAELVPGTAIAGVFTQSKTRSAPVLDCEKKLGGDPTGGAAFFVNSGNANAFTGSVGDASVRTVSDAVARQLSVPEDRVFTASTGVIGERLPHEKILGVVETLHSSLDADGIEPAAHAIMTTDTFAKGAGRKLEIDGKHVNVAGIAKGSGMIAPDMATMLVYIFTDARCDQSYLQSTVLKLNERTFNCITVDGDTSTSDTLLVAATGISDADVTGRDDFEEALSEVMLDLAHQVVRDGEGATKFVSVTVTGAENSDDAKRVGFSIANSPLVKTAIAGEDPNWGRVVMAIGKSGAAADRDRLTIKFGPVLVAENGQACPTYKESEAAAHMQGEEVDIHVDLGLGSGEATVWTCDLTSQYISINADYRS